MNITVWGLLAIPLLSFTIADRALAQSYEGEAVLDELTYTARIFPNIGGTQQEVICTLTQQVSFENLRVSLSPPSMTFDFNLRTTEVIPDANHPEIICGIVGEFVSPVSVTNVVVRDDGVFGYNNAETYFVDLYFSEDRIRLDGTAGYTLFGTTFPAQHFETTGFASLTLTSSPQSLLEALIEHVVSLNIRNGIGSALDSKLQNALDALDRAQAGDCASAIGILEAFIHSVEAQRGKAISDAQADELVVAAREIIAAFS